MIKNHATDGSGAVNIGGLWLCIYGFRRRQQDGRDRNTGLEFVVKVEYGCKFLLKFIGTYNLTLIPPYKLSAKLLVCFNFQSTSILLKVGEYAVWVANILDLDETPSKTPSYSASHPDPNFLHITLQLLFAGLGTAR